MRIITTMMAAILLAPLAVWAAEGQDDGQVEQLRKEIEVLRQKMRQEAEAKAPQPKKEGDDGLSALKQNIESLRRELNNATPAARDETAALKAEVAGLRQALNEALKLAVDAQSGFKKGQVLSVIKVTTSKEDADAFVKAFTDSPKASHKMKGFRGLAVAENVKQPGSFMVISLWDDEDSLNAYVSSKGFGDDHEKTGHIKSANVEPPGRFLVKEN
jgi:heme-degrading monooxygenase HmoA